MTRALEFMPVVLVLLWMAAPHEVAAFGNDGHRICQIAWRLIEPDEQKEVDRLMRRQPCTAGGIPTTMGRCAAEWGQRGI